MLYGVAVDEKVRILQENRENYEVLDESLLKCLDTNRKYIVLAAAEVIGKRFSVHEQLSESFCAAIAKKESKEIGFYINILEKVTVNYPKLLDNKAICFKLSPFFLSLSGTTRASLLKLFFNYAEYIKTCARFNNIPDFCEYLYVTVKKLSTTMKILIEFLSSNFSVPF